MFARRIWRIFFFLVVTAGLVVGGVALYRMGFTQGAMTNLTLPEGAEGQWMPHRAVPYGWHYGPRLGLLGFFPLLCLGSFFFISMMFMFGIFSRKRAWMHAGPWSRRGHWKYHGPHPDEDLPKDNADDTPLDSEESI